MPSLMRFLTVIGVLAGLGFGGMYALATFVTPRTREMTVTIPTNKLRAQPTEAEARLDRDGPHTAAVGGASQP
ncbi:hypothetical protein [Methylopila turkensis]|nr:hypothetical protein [Methylopila turkensis]